jgi:membrane fusion protein, copper/silver efflux system
MKKARTLLLSVVLVGAGFGAARLFPSSSGGAPGAASRKVLYWVDPMHPAYRSDKAGIAPDCGMQLEPVYADGGPAAGAGGPPRPAGTVSMGSDLRQLQGVRVGAVERAPSTQALRLFGRVVPDETRVYTVNAALEGSIRQLSDVTSGAFVKKDQWLGAFFSADIRAPLQALMTSLDVMDKDPLARRESGMALYAGTTASSSARFSAERLHQLGMSWRQIEEMHEKRAVPLTIDIRSPADGIVLARNVTLEQKYEKGMEWFRIANLDKVWILADVSEADAALARPGAKARVALPGEPAALTAVVSKVAPQFDAASRTMKVRLELANPGARLRPDMFVDVELDVERPEAITIPADALVDSGRRKTVFVEKGEGTFEPRTVEAGWRFGDRVEIVRGLSPGERIVTSGTFLVDSESQLRAAAAGVHGEPVKDPVCGMEIDEAKARAAGKTAEAHGKTFFFCSDTCKSRFHESPERFAGAPAAHDHEREHDALAGHDGHAEEHEHTL